MALKPRVGQVINGYEIVRLLNTGMFAFAYEARCGGKKAFLKLYKSPTIAVKWYRKYVEYEKELKHRIESGAAKNFCVNFGDFFEAQVGSTPSSKCYFQTYEFVEGGIDLQSVVDNSVAANFQQRVIMAKLMLASVNALHTDARVVHADLKPHNIQLFPDASITAGYRLKLIDMDRSLLVDRKAPWKENGEGHTGTPNYYSPEHLRGEDPQPASDVYTLALILYDLLAQGNPYASDDPEHYKTKALAGRPPAPVFKGTFEAPASANQIAEYMMRALDPKPSTRPTAMELNRALNGKLTPSAPEPKTATPERRTATPEPPKAEPAVEPHKPDLPPTPEVPEPPRVEPIPPTVPEPLKRRQLILMGEGDRQLKIGIRTEFGERLARTMGEESRFVDKNLQFVLLPKDNRWYVEPSGSTVNETLVNGKQVTDPTELNEGDILAIGREAKGIQKLKMKVTMA